MRYNVKRRFILHLVFWRLLLRMCAASGKPDRVIKEGIFMENQRISVFQQRNRWGITVVSLVLCLVLSPVLVLSLAVPQILMLLPVVLLWLLGCAGPVSAGGCIAILTGFSFYFLGGWGALSVLLFLAPVLIVSGALVERGSPMFIGAGVSSAAMFISCGLVMGLLTLLAGSDIVTAISGLCRQAFEATGKMGDSLLVMLMELGLIAEPDGLSYLESSGLLSLDAAARSDMIDQLILAIDSMLRLEIPMQMSTGSIAAGVIGQAALRKGLRSRGEAVDCPALHTWRIPEGWGRVLGGTWAILLVFSMLFAGRVSSMYYVFTGVVELLFSLQGIAAVCYLLHERGKGSVLKGIVFVLGFTLLRSMAIVLGIADQAVDITKRREKLGKTGWEISFTARKSER